MLPQNVLSTTPVRGVFAGARSLGITNTIDYHDGGIAIQDPSRGLLYQRWRARLLDAGESGSRVILDSPNTPEFMLYQEPGITEISIAFDQNMNPALAYVQEGAAKLWWYDSMVGEMVVYNLPTSAITPRIALDDQRLSGQGLNDLIVAYKIGNNLYYRQQRDRFLTQIDPTADLPEPSRTNQRAIIASSGGIIKIGLSRRLRFQFMLDIV